MFKTDKFMEKPVYTTYEIGKICYVDLTTVISWIEKGILPGYRTPGGHRRVTKEDLIDFLKKYRLPLPPEWAGSEKKKVSKEVLTSEVTVSKDDSFTQQIPSPVVSLKVSGEKSEGKTRVSVVKLPKEGDSLEVKTEKLYQEILQLLDREEYDFALKKIDELLKMDKFLPEGYYLRGVVEGKLNHLEEAIAEFKRTIYLDKDFLMAHFNLGEIYAQVGKKKNALREYKNVFRILEDGKIEDPIPFSGGFGKKALINLCERYIQRLNPNKEKEKIPGIAPG